LDELKTNVLYFGDNLEILRNHEYFPDECIDLIYLDPPFNSKKDYPKIQLLTIDELLQGKTVDMPPQTQTNVTFAKAQKISEKEGEQLAME